MIQPPPISTPTDTLVPYTTPFRSAIAIQKQVLAIAQPEQRDWLEAAVAGRAEHDRVVRLHAAELGRERHRRHHLVAEARAATGVHAQVAVVDRKSTRLNSSH